MVTIAGIVVIPMTLEYTSARKHLTRPSILRRYAATAIDGAVWLLLAWQLQTAVIFLVFAPLSKWLAAPLMCCVPLVFPAYLAMEIVTSASLGKFLTRQRVCTSDGGKVMLSRRCLRWALKSAPWLLTCALLWTTLALNRDILPERFQGKVVVATYTLISPLFYPLQWLPEPLRWGANELAARALSGVSMLSDGLWIAWPLLLGEFLIFGRSRRTLIDRLSRTTVFQKFP